MSTLFASASPAYLEVTAGQPTRISLSVGNTSSIIDGYVVRVYGVDADWVTTEPARMSLFPGAIDDLDVVLQLPDGFPSGMRQLSIHVQSENDPSHFEIASVTINVASQPALSLTVDPTSITGGGTAQFGIVVVNRGNSILDVVPDAVDPEDTATFEFDPPQMHLLPGEQSVFRAAVRAPRPWVGQPTVRVLTFLTRSPEQSETMATFVQRPRIGRWLLSMLGLITAAAVFAAVLSHTLSGVVDEAKVSDDVVNEALANGKDGGEQVSVNPATIGGTVVSAASGTPVAGVQAQLFRADDGNVPVASAATGDDGTFAFGRLGGGTYRVKFSGAGFADSWYSTGRVFAEAADVEVATGKSVALDPMQLGGRPGSVSGKVVSSEVGGDISGAIATLVVPGIADPTTPAVVAKVDVSADGSFALVDVPSPADYQLVVTRPGSATATREIVLGPAQPMDDISIVLSEGDGMISGHVLDGAGALGAVTIEATDGTTTISTVSLTDGDVGSYALRSLATPGRYTLTITREGYTTVSRTISLGEGQSLTSDLVLNASIGTISGTVRTAGGDPLGGVTVSVTGGETTTQTSSISQGAGAGTWSADSLAVPGTYTITFSKPGYVSQSRLVPLDGTTAGGAVTDIDAALVRDTATITGTVFDVNGVARGQATVTLSDGSTNRTLFSADEPAGAFAFTGVPPGSYTLTVSLPGASSVVQVVTVTAGASRDLTVQLGQQASLTGSVVFTPSQAPAAGLVVRMYAPGAFPGSAASALASTTVAADGTYSFIGINAPADFVVAVYATGTSVDPLDSELVSSVPGTAVTVPTFAVPQP